MAMLITLMTESSSSVAMMSLPLGEKNASSETLKVCLRARSPGFGELPADAALRVHDQKPVVVVVGDQDVAGQRGRTECGAR